jgi:MFS family permease
MSSTHTTVRRLPSWVLGLPHATGGFMMFVFVAIPILLSARGVSVEQIAWVSAVGGSPISWAFLLCPVFDTRLSRRTYLLLLSTLAAVCATAAMLLFGHLYLLTAVLTLGEAAAWSSSIVCYAWKSEFLEADQVPSVCAWSEVSSLGGGGLFAGYAVWCTRTLHGFAPIAVGIGLLLPTASVFLFPRVAIPLRSAGEVFRTFFGDLWTLCKAPRVRFAILVFLLPEAAFAFAFGAVGADFHASEHTVGLLTGPLSGFACAAGALLAVPLCRRFTAEVSYILPGLVCAASLVALLLLPKSTYTFGIACLLYSLMQGINFASFSTLALELAGRANPLATTLVAMLAGIANLCTIYMKPLDGHAYTLKGINGMLGVDALVSFAVGGPLLWLLHRRHVHRRNAAATAALAETLMPLRID